ncbi:MAG: hypothetical protein J4431_01710 [Candidatus Aenigmarchaeota archaeon]|nr:hypothetical protein [Candidatus Aenigmarchaeota archaeon]
MKGMLDIEFILAIAIFIGTASFILLTINSQIPFLEEKSDFNNIIAESYRISDMLAYGSGTHGWETLIAGRPEDVEMIGLSSGRRFYLSREKLNALHGLCNPPVAANFVKLESMLASGGGAGIQVTDRSGNALVSCPPPGSAGVSEYTARRVLLLDRFPLPPELLTLDVTVTG